MNRNKNTNRIAILIKRMLSIFLVILQLCMCCGTVYAASGDESTVSDKRKVRVGCAVSIGYHQKDENGKLTGYGYSYEQLVAQYANWDIEYVEGNWSDLQDMLKDGRIDLLGFLVDTEEREENYSFSRIPAGTSMSCLITRADSKYSYQDYTSFNEMIIGCVKSNANMKAFEEYAKLNSFDVNIMYYDTYQQLFSAIDDGSVNAGLVTNFQKISSYKVIDQFLPTNFYYAVNKSNEELLVELNEAMTDIETCYSDFTASLYSKYLDSKNGINIAFTSEELEYLKKNPVVKVVPCGRKIPYEAYDKKRQKYIGIVPDILTEISKITGIKFEYCKTNDRWLFEHENMEGNVITSFTCDMDWAKKKNISITQPFIESTISVIYKKMPKENVTAAVVKGIYLEYILKKIHPDWNIKYYDTTEQCINAVKKGLCTCTIINAYEADYYLSMGKYNSLNEKTMSGVVHNIGFGVTEDTDEELLRIISKTLMMIPAEDADTIIRKNTNIEPPNTLEDELYIHPIRVIGIPFIFIIVLVSFIFMHIYTRSVRRKNSEIIEASKAKSDFLSRVSHDLRTPMNAIINLTNMVENEIDDREAAIEDISKIKTSNMFLLSLINDVLDVSKMENRQMELHPEPYSYKEFLNYMESTFKPLCIEKNIELSIERGACDSDIIIDKVRFNQLCFNLLSNAVKYTKSGGKVWFRMQHGEVYGRKLPCDIYVSDNGIGMSKEFQKKMCEPFSQEGRAYRTVEGTGLGLYIVKQIVDLLGGTIDVESELNKGTTIHVHLEMELSEEQKHEENLSEIDTGILKDKRILIAEDHVLNQEIAKRLLEGVGAIVEIANDGAEAIEMYEEGNGKYDCILMDIRMPIMDGLKAAEIIRELDTEDAKTIPIIAMTANAYDFDVKSTMKAGMNEHLSKPIKPDLLFSTLIKYFTCK